ncbi:MAG: IS66 family insertion sequence element accessory protein TnpB [Bdellovibrio sp.]|nr:IS66 family insertion sequence element accessory protein TnpB [Bdellovibrio sp.]
MNKPRTHIKILYFVRSGFARWLKRLRSVQFSWPRPLDRGEAILMSANDLEFIFGGVYIYPRFNPVHFEKIIS